MLRKLLLSGLVLGATLVAAPTMLGSVNGSTLRDNPFANGMVATHGSQSAPPLGAGRLRIGVPVRSSLTIANDGGVRARYLLSARVEGDRAFASRLRFVVTRRSDHARVFVGSVARLQEIDLGSFGARTDASFDLSVTLVSAGSVAADNALQTRSGDVQLGWTATRA